MLDDVAYRKGFAWYFYLKALLYMRLADIKNNEFSLHLLKKIEKNLKLAISIKPNFIRAYISLGWLYEFLGKKANEEPKIAKKIHITFGERLYEKDIVLYKLAIKLAKNEREKNKLFLNLGNIYFRIGLYEKSAKYYKKAYKNIPKIDLKKKRFLLYRYGYSLYQIGKYKEAIKVYKKLVRILSEKQKIYRVKEYIALSEFIGKEYKSAIKTFYEVLRLGKEIGIPKKEEIGIMQNISLCYLLAGDYDNAIKTELMLDTFFQKDFSNEPQRKLKISIFYIIPISFSIDTVVSGFSYPSRFFHSLSLYERKLLHYGILIEIYKRKGIYDKAITLYHKKIIVAKELPSPTKERVLAISYNNIAILYAKQKKYNTALSYYEKALQQIKPYIKKALEKIKEKESDFQKIKNKFYHIQKKLKKGKIISKEEGRIYELGIELKKPLEPFRFIDDFYNIKRNQIKTYIITKGKIPKSEFSLKNETSLASLKKILEYQPDAIKEKYDITKLIEQGEEEK